MNYDIQIISAPSILGLKPSGVEELGETLLNNGLRENLQSTHACIQVHAPNDLYTTVRDPETNCINSFAAKSFSLHLSKTIQEVLEREQFPLVLGGDCSVLLGIMPALKKKKLNCGLLFLDAHADFYRPEQSPTGELADMDLAVVTGRGPELLTNIDGLKPYVIDRHVVHIGQRDQDETMEYHAEDIRTTEIHCVSAAEIQSKGYEQVTLEVTAHVKRITDVAGFWLHFDTDVISDEENPAVDYRIPGGLKQIEIQHLLHSLLRINHIVGMSVTIYNPRLDTTGSAGRNITQILANAFK